MNKTKTTAPPEVARLCEQFAEHLDVLKGGSYNETQVRREFIDPLFKALGWDIDNRAGYAEQYKDVVHEDALKVGGATKAPDYCFRIGGVRKFFLEAKKPSVHIKQDTSPAYQLRRYAWSAKLPLSILTDFEEFAVYDCRVKPVKNDKASVARIMYFTFDQYADKWDEIAGVFSPEAIKRGSFDKYVESHKKKRGTAEVDDVFLAEIERWREMLAKNVALRNEHLHQRELNTAVQRTIDRIIFLRICEDRAIEEYGRLQALMNGGDVYGRLKTLFHNADDRYNSGLFHFKREPGREDYDNWTLKLAIDDKPLKEIIRGLYYPDSPYEFSVLPADILGQVYEQFLGKVIRLTPGHRAVVEDKPEVKKAGGVYYTPTYIVNYIVEHTVGKLLEGFGSGVSGLEKPGIGSRGSGLENPKALEAKSETRNPKPETRANPKPETLTLRVLDPACGSGSFLLGAYQYLLDWFLERYSENPAKYRKGKSPRIVEAAAVGPGKSVPSFRLTIDERKRILLDHIYGVDIDPQAVEVTKLSLLLKVLEGETRQTLQSQLELIHQRALPDLAGNIKCGNSLIGPDFYHGRQLDLSEEEHYRINVFDWQMEFADVFAGKNPGFDAVIGNPPYIRVRIFRSFAPEQAEYLQRTYEGAKHVWDIYLLFFEKALSLSRTGGRISFIVPIQTLHQPNCYALRKLLHDQTAISAIADLSQLRVFQKAIVKNAVLVAENGTQSSNDIAIYQPSEPEQLSAEPVRFWSQALARSNEGLSLKLDLLSPLKSLCDDLRARSYELQELCYVTFGLRSCAKGVGGGGKDRLITEDCEQDDARLYLEGRDIGRYSMQWPGKCIKYIPSEMYSPRSPELFEQRKIVSQSMLSKPRIIATLDERNFYVEQSLVCIVPEKDGPEIPLEAILGFLNSRLNSFYFRTNVIDYSLGGGLIHATPGSQQKLLVPKLEQQAYDSVHKLTRRMLDLHARLAEAKTGHDKNVLQRQIEATDREIDRLVYALYGLTEVEIKIIEEATG